VPASPSTTEGLDHQKAFGGRPDTNQARSYLKNRGERAEARKDDAGMLGSFEEDGRRIGDRSSFLGWLLEHRAGNLIGALATNPASKSGAPHPKGAARASIGARDRRTITRDTGEVGC
jgi:hypothetical protein